MKVLVSDNLSPKGVEILEKGGLTVDVKTGMSPDELKACIGEYHGLVIRSATKVTAEILESAVNLKVIGRAGSGLDNVDRAAASKKGVVVMNTPGGNTVTTAEHSFAMIMALARNIPQANASMKAGKWEKKKFMGVELFGKVLGVLGLGNIGKEVAKRAQGFGMHVLAYDPFLSDEQAEELAVEKASLEAVFARSDFITIHTPKTPETAGVINEKTIASMKQGVRIINCARGGIINETDLLTALNTGKVAGAALDVFDVEPPTDNPLLGAPNLICTPHLGASTSEAQVNVAVAVAEQIVDYLVNGTIRNAVNFPSIPADQMTKLRPYLNLAERMGLFASQIIEGGVRRIAVEFGGDATEIDTAPVNIAALKGFLEPMLEETVNFVNAPFIAKERGIDVTELKDPDAGDYSTRITLRIQTDSGETVVQGTLFSKRLARIVRVDNFPVEIIPEGELLFIKNNDKPGVIGNIGGLLGENGINIARMHFGRESAGGLAISVVTIDSPAGPEILDKVNALPNILTVNRIVLP